MSQAPKLTYFDSCSRFKDKRFHAFFLKNSVLLQGMVGALALAVAVLVAAVHGALVVAWTRRNNNQGVGQWMRWQSPPVRTRADWRQAWEQAAQWARTPGDAERRYEVTLLPLDNWQIFYYRGGAWSNPQSSTGTPTGDSTSAIPDGIRLQITLPPGQALTGQLTRDWVNPVLGGGRS